MSENRVVQGRMVTPEKLAEMIEGSSVVETDNIQDAGRECPECGGSVLEIVYLPEVTQVVTGWKCQDCDWKDSEKR
ncbi:MAG: DUF5795 family protein [Halobacteria archaeon]|nr:DUF5795 family protein [Halobacteria archaeon]